MDRTNQRVSSEEREVKTQDAEHLDDRVYSWLITKGGYEFFVSSRLITHVNNVRHIRSQIQMHLEHRLRRMLKVRLGWEYLYTHVVKREV